jgi:hypothetical protein
MRTFPGLGGPLTPRARTLIGPTGGSVTVAEGQGNLGARGVAMLKCFGEWRLTKCVRGRTPRAITELAAGISVLWRIRQARARSGSLVFKRSRRLRRSTSDV